MTLKTAEQLQEMHDLKGENSKHKAHIRSLQRQLQSIRRDNLSNKEVRESIFGLASRPARPPTWSVLPKTTHVGLAIPTVNFSDWHWGEVVRPEEINGINEFNLAIAVRRLQRLVKKIISLCDEHKGYKYPGINVILGGDMVSGDIHPELENTNEMPLLPTLLHLFDKLVWALSALADHFKHVWVVCVTGNHGRNTKKPQAKNRQYTNFDWLLYQMLERHFKSLKDDRFTFFIPDGFDASFKIYNHRYLLTHGDNLGVAGGDGIIGAIGPIMRGSVKVGMQKRRIGIDFDTIVMGHWHQYIALKKIMVNGTLKGYDEYAMMRRFDPEPPCQALWFTHPKYGIGYTVDILLEEPKDVAAASQVIHIQ
jgi:predicted phosphodiesterase